MKVRSQKSRPDYADLIHGLSANILSEETSQARLYVCSLTELEHSFTESIFLRGLCMK